MFAGLYTYIPVCLCVFPIVSVTNVHFIMCVCRWVCACECSVRGVHKGASELLELELETLCEMLNVDGKTSAVVHKLPAIFPAPCMISSQGSHEGCVVQCLAVQGSLQELMCQLLPLTFSLAIVNGKLPPSPGCVPVCPVCETLTAAVLS